MASGASGPRSSASPGETSGGTARGIGLELLGFALLALLIRLVLLWAPAADMVGLGSHGEPIDHHGEELSRGNIAAQFLRGPLLRTLDYQWSESFGGSLVVGLLAIPGFLVLGESLFALKLVPIGFALLLVVALYLIGLRLGGRLAARSSALLAAVGFPGLVVFQSLAWGTHAEVAALGALFGWLSIRASSDACPGSRLRFLQGLLAGFALYFGQGFALFLVPVLGFELLQRRRQLLVRSSLAAALGFLLGFLPWVLYNTRHGFVGLRHYGRSFVEQFDVPAAELPGRAVELWTAVLPRTLYMRDSALELTSAGTWVLLGVLLVPVLVAVIALLKRRRLEPAWLFVAHIVLFAFVAAASRYHPDPRSSTFVEFRYPLLIVPSLFALAGLGLASARLRSRRLAPALLGIWVLASLVGIGRLADPARAGTYLERDGAVAAGHGRWMALRYAHDIPLLARALERAETRRTPEERAELYAAMARALLHVNDPERAARNRRAARRDTPNRQVHEWLRANAPPEHRDLFVAEAEELRAIPVSH